MEPFVSREICGTDAGYRKHRRMSEERCQPCKDAHNIVRRQTYKPEKNSQYKKNYYANPEKQAARVEYHKRYDKDLGRVLTDQEFQERKERVKAKRKARKEATQKKVLLTKLLKLITKRKEYLERKESIQHGTTYSEAVRCIRYFGSACESCKVSYNQYVRETRLKNVEQYRARAREYKKRVGYPPNHRTRAKQNGVKSEYYTREQIIDRDGYNCYLCSKPIDLSGSHIVGRPGWELYPHIEHVVPLSRGGTDTLDNVKIAHAKCNLDKGTKLLDEIITTV